MQAHPIGVNGQVWGGTRAYTVDKRDALHRAVANFTRDYPDAKAAVIPTFQFGLPANALNLLGGPLIFFFYDGPTPPAGIFDDFDAIESSSDDTKTQTYYSLANAEGGADITGVGNSFHVTTLPNLPTPQMAQLYSKLFNLTYAQSLGDSLTNLDVQLLGYDPQPVSVRIAAASQAQGGNALGLDPDHGDRIWVEHDMLWLNQLCDTQCPKYAAAVSDAIRAYANSTFAGVKPTNYKSGDISRVSYNPLFMNDAAPDQDVYGSYPPANLARLQAIKKAYDPTGFFTQRQGGFKLP
nr:putative fad-linked oxidoreductase [Quercus suber]POE94764.1 putative fad-linked oxidoreductase [Quercus suber]